MTEPVDFPSKSGATARGAIAYPTGEGRAPAVVVLQEWWGLNDHIRSLADRLAADGFVALAPDLFHGKVTLETAEAMHLMQELKWPEALKDIAGAVDYLKASPRVNGKVGVTGFCMGGAGALVAAGNVPGVDAAVAFYGLPPPGAVDWAKVKVPLQGHYARRDQHMTVAKAEALRAEVTSHGGTLELFTYDADHAFVNDTRPEVYNPEAARDAWQRMVAFFHKHLG